MPDEYTQYRILSVTFVNGSTSYLVYKKENPLRLYVNKETNSVENRVWTASDLLTGQTVQIATRYVIKTHIVTNFLELEELDEQLSKRRAKLLNYSNEDLYGSTKRKLNLGLRLVKYAKDNYYVPWNERPFVYD